MIQLIFTVFTQTQYSKIIEDVNMLLFKQPVSWVSAFLNTGVTGVHNVCREDRTWEEEQLGGRNEDAPTYYHYEELKCNNMM